jgi:D-specific alpha-keto acid dehydrogenase
MYSSETGGVAATSVSPPSSSMGTALQAVCITVYGCDLDEAKAFTQLAPVFGVIPTLTSAPVSAASIVSEPGNRCISVGHKTEISSSTLRALRDAGVEYLSTRSIGFDHIDVRAADRLGITVENVVYSPDGVADFTLMLILIAIRNAKETLSSAAINDFRVGRIRGGELRDMTVGVVGAGHIGAAVIERLRGFGCRVLVHSNSPSTAATARRVSLDELLRESDVVTLHLPLNPATHHFIGRDEIATMKHGAYLVNTGRGALIDTEALINGLERGRLGGAALDVLEGEDGHFYVDWADRPLDHPFLTRLQAMPNVVITPHTAYYTRGALRDTVERTLMNCLNFERGEAK